MHAVATPGVPVEQVNLSQILADLAASSRRIQVAPREAVYEPGDSATNVYLIIEGQIRSHQVGPNGSRRLIEILGAGDWCGAPSLARLTTYGERAEAAVPSVVVAIPADRFFTELVRHPAAALELVGQLAAKLSAFREEAAELVFDDCHKRLIRTLQRLSDSPAASRSAEGVVLRITHQQLAQAVGVARETVSLALSELRRKNLLRTGRNQLFFDPARLVAANVTTVATVSVAS